MLLPIGRAGGRRAAPGASMRASAAPPTTASRGRRCLATPTAIRATPAADASWPRRRRAARTDRRARCAPTPRRPTRPRPAATHGHRPAHHRPLPPLARPRPRRGRRPRAASATPAPRPPRRAAAASAGRASSTPARHRARPAARHGGRGGADVRRRRRPRLRRGHPRPPRRREHVVASFGITGQWAKANPDLVRRMAADGHLVFNHTARPPLVHGRLGQARRAVGGPPARRADDADAIIAPLHRPLDPAVVSPALRRRRRARGRRRARRPATHAKSAGRSIRSAGAACQARGHRRALSEAGRAGRDLRVPRRPRVAGRDRAAPGHPRPARAGVSPSVAVDQTETSATPARAATTGCGVRFRRAQYVVS